MARRTSSLYYCGRRRRWFYALVVTGAVTFMAAMPFVAEKPTVFQAEAWVSPPSAAFKRSEPNPAVQLASGLRDALPNVVLRVPGTTWTEAELNRLADATTIRMNHIGKYTPDVALTLEWDDAESAERLVRALAEELCDRKNREIPAPVSVSNDQATAIRQCAEILRDEARDEVAELKQIIANHDKRHAATVEVTAPKKEPAGAVRVVNPAWASLQRELEELDSQRSKLLELYTEQHPRVKNLMAHRDELAARLAQTPQQIETGPETAPQENPSPDVRPTPSQAAVAERQRLIARLAQLERNLADEDDLLRQAIEAERRATSAQPVSDSRWWLRAYTNAEARAGSRLSAPLSWLGIVSLLAGSFVALGVVGIRPTYDSAAEAFARLPALVVGVIPAEGPVHRPVSIRTWAARLVGLCEWAMIAVAVFLALAVWKNPHFGQRLLADPLTVLATPGDWIPWLRR